MNRARAQLATMNDSKREWELYKLRDKLDALMVKVPRKLEKLKVKSKAIEDLETEFQRVMSDVRDDRSS